MIATLLRGDEQVVGNFTSGGTESLLLAVKTARDYARVRRPEVTQPEIVLPRTVHGAVHKAARYFGLKPVVTPFDPVTFKADIGAMRKAVTKNTVLLVASAPGYAQGVIDPIAEVGALAQEHGLLFHVDACVGGIQLSFMRKIGYPVPDFDFAVPGVTSISTDMHKYGYAAKNASTILYRNKELRRHQLFACCQTTTYALINPAVMSTKTAGPIAGAWAILHYLGEEGYMKIVRATHEAAEKLVAGINAIPGLRVLGKPDMCMFSFASEGFNIYQLADEMTRRGWYIQPQFSTAQSPPNLHVTVNMNTVDCVEPFLAELREAVEVVKRAEPIRAEDVRATLEPLLQGDPREAFGQLAAFGGLNGAELPEQMALINTVLDALPDEITEGLLVEFMNDLYT
jgi:glutamate/tyrosine decarboxylase-like PLP-dependent enzyme